MLEERQAATVTRQYVWNAVGYVNSLVLRDDNSVAGSLGTNSSGLGQRLYVQQDANHDVTALTDTTGNVKQRYVDDPYGLVTVLTPTWTNTTDAYSWSYGFQGGRVDPVTGLYHFGARDYSPTLGRWMQMDPIGYPDGLNPFGFVRSSPVGSVDPTGLKEMQEAEPVQEALEAMAIEAESEEGNGIPAFELCIRIIQMLPIANEALGDPIDTIIFGEPEATGPGFSFAPPGKASCVSTPYSETVHRPVSGADREKLLKMFAGGGTSTSGGDFDSPPASGGAPAPDGQRTEPTPGSSGGDFGGGSGGDPGDQPAPPPTQGPRPTDPKNHPGGAGDGSGGDHGNGTTTGNPDTQPDSGGAAEKGVNPLAEDAADYANANNGAARPGYRGGSNFANDGRGGGQVLPSTDSAGNPITYKEYDTNPYQAGTNRGPERVVIGSDGSAYYTSDHYTTFTKFR